jgi:hypothetical protein
MVRVERACLVYVRFVSAILALADARSDFDVAGFDSKSFDAGSADRLALLTRLP